jgi:peptidoglycan/LPS O-acetylase OafA/YrhL
MEYRREIDGLRALAVLPVILFHAGFDTFSGGFVGVDIFFVISGYLITTIILNELGQGSFSLVNFYERRARRILPALFFVILVSLPFAWLWLMPSAMKEFSRSLIAVSLFSSNILFWRESGYFDMGTELKPLLHTWSLAVEEQYYILFPAFFMLIWRFGVRAMLVILSLIAVASLAIAQWGSIVKPTATFYLVPTRGWELLIGALVAFYLSRPDPRPPSDVLRQAGSLAGGFLLLYSIIVFDERIPSPSIYTLVPVLGTALIICYANNKTLIGKLLGYQVLVGLGLVSYSAYLWHQPIFSLARHRSLSELGPTVFGALTLLTLLLAYLTWTYIETPFRDKSQVSRNSLFWSSLAVMVLLIGLGIAGNYTDGFKNRFDLSSLPKPWSSIKCHGANTISELKDPLAECLGAAKNGRGGDIFLLGDSHAAQLTFPLSAVAKSRNKDLRFISTDALTDFPQSFFSSSHATNDRLLNRILEVADSGDILIIAFHRGYLNEQRDKHLDNAVRVVANARADNFYKNMMYYLPRLIDAGLTIYLIKDTPLLPNAASLEKCALYKMRAEGGPCSISLAQDEHTRARQSILFDALAKQYSGKVFSLDPLPLLYAGKDIFDPISNDGTYKMFDRHHLTETVSLELVPYFQKVIRSRRPDSSYTDPH